MPLPEEYILGKNGIIKNYLDENGVENIQLNSFEHCINHSLEKIIQEETFESDSQGVKTVIKFKNIDIENPTVIEDNRIKKKITPMEARIRKQDYWGTVFIDVDILQIKNQRVIYHKYFTKHPLCKFPIMLGSSKCNLYNKTLKEKVSLGECEYDKGGYFITSGHERVIISQIRMNYNVPIILKSKISKYKFIGEIRSMSNETGHSILIKTFITHDGRQVTFSLPGISTPIEAGIVFKALGFVDAEIINFINPINPAMRNLATSLLYNAKIISSKSDALEYIGKRTMQVIPQDKYQNCASQILEHELFPHCGIYTLKTEIAIILANIISKLYLTFLGLRSIDNRDHLSNKRIDTTGMLLRDLFRPLFKRWARSLCGKKKLEIMAGMSITQSLKHAIMTGSWSAPKTAWARQGVSQILMRWNIGSTLSHKRRIMIPVGKEGKNTDIRQIHSSEAFFICPCETPEGHAVGIVKNLALLTDVTNEISVCEMRNFLENLNFIKNLDDIEVADINKYNKIWLNGIPIGLCDNLAISALKNLRKNKLIPYSVSISHQNQDIMIFSDDGRCIRPLFMLDDDNKLLISEKDDPNWTELLDQQKIGYFDTYEIEDQIVAMYESELEDKNFTCMEIFPVAMLGIMGNTIPYPDHTQSPRNTYQAAMGKQAMSIFTTNTHLRTDTVVHELIYPQQPLVRTHVAEHLGFCKQPYGNNAICAVMCYSGYNQEDAKILNQGSIDLGFMRNFTFRTLTVEECRNGNGYETICIPPKNLYFKSRNYNKLDKDGIIKVGEKINLNDVLVGKTYQKTKKNVEIIDMSRFAKKNELGIVDSVFITETPNGYKLIKIKIRILKIPEPGDKFASCCAQKGTVGITFNRADMPFTSEGITPDIIINAHAFPSRMTINELIEAMASKISTITGQFHYSTPFSSHSKNIIPKLCSALDALGFDKYGNEVMYNGFTGEKIDAQIFVAPIYKQRLKHLVDEKIHARDHGPMQLLFKQPLEGRARNGGLRFGEMEHDCLVSYGASNLLLERLLKVSDPYYIYICADCKLISNKEKQCTICKSDNIHKTSIPYASKLLFQLLNALCIKIIIETKSSEVK